MSKLFTMSSNNLFAQFIAQARTPLYRNGYLLTISSGVTALLGVVYWIIAARLYPPEIVGVNSAMIATLTLVSSIAQLSLNNALFRFVPVAGSETGRIVRYAYIISLNMSALLSATWYLSVWAWFPEQKFATDNVSNFLWFVFSSMIWCVFALQDGVLTGLRQTNLVLLKNSCFSIVKIILLVYFAKAFPGSGIFASWIIPAVILILPIDVLMFIKLIPRHITETTMFERFDISHIVRFVAGNYLGALFSVASTMFLPIMVTQYAGATATAYFYLPWTVSSSLQLVSMNMATSLTVEGASNEKKLLYYAYKTLMRTMQLMLPVVFLIAAFSTFILRVFGSDYAVQGSRLLQLLVIGTFFNSISMVYLALLRVKKNIAEVVFLQSITCVLVLSLSYNLIPSLGIEGVGWAWAVSQVIVALFVLSFRFVPMLRRS